MKSSPIVGVAMMVKNETKRIHVTLESCIGVADCMIVFDTGSTDNTIEIISSFCEKHKIPLHLKKGEFLDFSKSRNVLLNFADNKADYLIQLDCNDEIKNGDAFKNFIKNFHAQNRSDICGFQTCQQWLFGGRIDKFFNMRLIKTKQQWKYKCRVHEYIMCPLFEKNPASIIRLPEEILTIFQNRTLDDDKSSKRFHRDKILLYEDFIDNPHEPRTLFYLAQSCACLNQYDEAFKYYKLRIKETGFIEETYHCYFRCGELSNTMGHSWEECMGWYISALEFSETIFKNPRLEPLVPLITHYFDSKKYRLAYLFCKKAISLSYPDDALLFVNRMEYEYTRYHHMAIVGYYCGKMKEGRESCLKAIKYGIEHPIIDPPLYKCDIDNLKFYIKDDKKRQDVINLLKEKSVSDVLGNVLDMIGDEQGDKDEERRTEISKCITNGKTAKKWEESLIWYIKSLEFGMSIEPLILLSTHYYTDKKWNLASMFCKMALELKHSNLPSEKEFFDYTRYHLMGIIGFYIKEFDLGKECCLKAISQGKNKIDKENLRYYESLPIPSTSLIPVSISSRDKLRMKIKEKKIMRTKR
jgi:glycosyltransferase involved in cell wall biosynthesis